MSNVRVFEQAEATAPWQYFDTSWRDILRRPGLPSARFMFDSSRLMAAPANIRQNISHQFKFPGYLYSEVCSRSNGFFWFGDIVENGNQKGHNIYFRLLVKHANPDMRARNAYVWYEMEFFTKWLTSNHTIVICFDVPPVFQTRLLCALRSQTGSLEYTDPYYFQTLIVHEIIKLHDESIWGLRHHIRGLEKARVTNQTPKPDYFVLHEISRHAIHSVETLNVAVDTVTAMCDQYKSILKHRKLWSNTSCATQSHLQYQLHMLRNLRSRSQSNEKRIHNEITYAYNSVAQRDSSSIVQAGEGARRDSATMRTIAMVTMTFLPATFLSALFSMSFFDYRPATDSHPESWSVSSKFWIYWALVVPLTMLTMGTWIGWQRFGGPFLIDRLCGQ